MYFNLLRRFAAAVVAAALLFSFLSPTIGFAMESRSNANLLGIDVSHWDGPIDWARLAVHHIRFAYVKATGGDSFVDPRFAANVRMARANGIAVGAYHYAKPTAPFKQEEAVRQASFFVHTMQSGMNGYGDVMPVLDVEQSGSLSTANLVRWIQVFVDTVEHQTHRQVMLYTSEDFIQRHANLNHGLSSLPLWVAYYDRYYGGRNPQNIAGWNHWSVWQYSDMGRISGVSGTVDLNAGPTSLAAIRGDLAPAAPAQSKLPAPTGPIAQSVPANAMPAPSVTAQHSTTRSPWSTRVILVCAIAVLAALASEVYTMIQILHRNKGHKPEY